MADYAQLAGQVLSIYSAVSGGNAANDAAQFEAGQLEVNAGQSRAAGQRAAIEQHRQERLALSALQARAGGGGLDPSLVKLAADIAGEGEYRALTALYEGEDRARTMENQAAATRYSGKQAQKAGYIRGVSSFMSGAQGLFERYGSKIPGNPRG